MTTYRKAISGFFTLVLAMSLFLGCGGSKETANFEPDPFPEVEQPQTTQPTTPEPKPVEVEDIQPPRPVILRTINFEFDRSSLTPEAKAILAENARQLLENPEINVRIEGHCDERGTVEYNLALGEKRAITTRDYLINFGISANRLTVISYGKERPLDPRHLPEAWDRNRRAEFVKLN
ncbi:MAG: peptidoglycan-associated lipoprotein Pal [bacterium]